MNSLSFFNLLGFGGQGKAGKDVLFQSDASAKEHSLFNRIFGMVVGGVPGFFKKQPVSPQFPSDFALWGQQTTGAPQAEQNQWNDLLMRAAYPGLKALENPAPEQNAVSADQTVVLPTGLVVAADDLLNVLQSAESNPQIVLVQKADTEKGGNHSDSKAAFWVIPVLQVENAGKANEKEVQETETGEQGSAQNATLVTSQNVGEAEAVLVAEQPVQNEMPVLSSENLDNKMVSSKKDTNGPATEPTAQMGKTAQTDKGETTGQARIQVTLKNGQRITLGVPVLETGGSQGQDGSNDGTLAGQQTGFKQASLGQPVTLLAEKEGQLANSVVPAGQKQVDFATAQTWITQNGNPAPKVGKWNPAAGQEAAPAQTSAKPNEFLLIPFQKTLALRGENTLKGILMADSQSQLSGTQEPVGLSGESGNAETISAVLARVEAEGVLKKGGKAVSVKSGNGFAPAIIVDEVQVENTDVSAGSLQALEKMSRQLGTRPVILKAIGWTEKEATATAEARTKAAFNSGDAKPKVATGGWGTPQNPGQAEAEGDLQAQPGTKFPLNSSPAEAEGKTIWKEPKTAAKIPAAAMEDFQPKQSGTTLRGTGSVPKAAPVDPGQNQTQQTGVQETLSAAAEPLVANRLSKETREAKVSNARKKTHDEAKKIRLQPEKSVFSDIQKAAPERQKMINSDNLPAREDVTFFSEKGGLSNSQVQPEQMAAKISVEALSGKSAHKAKHSVKTVQPESTSAETEQKVEMTGRPGADKPAGFNEHGRVERSGTQTAGEARGQETFPQLTRASFDRLVRHTRLLVQNQGGQMHIQLKPDVLGGARILVETLQNQISVKILVDKPETRHALEQHVQALHAAVAQQSGRVQEIQISIHVQSDATSQNQAQSNQGQNQHSGTSQENGQNRSFPTGYGKDTEARDDQKRMRQFGYNSMEKVA